MAAKLSIHQVIKYLEMIIKDLDPIP